MCLGADLHVAQLMPLPFTTSAPINPNWFYLPGFTFLVPAHPGSTGEIQESRKTVVCVCVCGVRVCTRTRAYVCLQHSSCIITKDMMIIGCCIRLPLLPSAVSQRIVVLFGKYDDLQVNRSSVQFSWSVC